MKKIHDIVGKTPLVQLQSIPENPAVRIFAKLEGQNPGGSVKDRAAKNMIDAAMERGDIRPGTTLVEATSGNTGIALAMMASLYSIPIELVMPSNATRERIKTMTAFGAKVTLLDTIEACRDYAEEKSRLEGYYMLDQFGNPDNYLAHYKTTGPEIWKDSYGQVTHFVSSMGTTGTIMGTSRFLKEQNPAIEIVGVQPRDGAKIPGIRRWPEEYLPRIYDRNRVDRIIDVGQADAEETMRRLAAEEGIFAGVSSGGAVHAALQLAQELDGAVIVVIVCDRGDRYLSTGVFPA